LPTPASPHPFPQVSPDEHVSTLKRLVSEKLNVPVSQQRLLFKGKALADEHRLSDYSIGPESKLNLVIKPLEKASPEEPGHRGPPPPFPTIWHPLGQVLARHFSTADAEKVLEQLQKVRPGALAWRELQTGGIPGWVIASLKPAWHQDAAPLGWGWLSGDPAMRVGQRATGIPAPPLPLHPGDRRAKPASPSRITSGAFAC
uniref:Ubiquitin like 4A n=1 Tax=Chelydra serpentina TaxID=8475 RepID=A0A8C3SEG2_CHESE